jgi:hypothetical protein
MAADQEARRGPRNRRSMVLYLPALQHLACVPSSNIGTFNSRTHWLHKRLIADDGDDRAETDLSLLDAFVGCGDLVESVSFRDHLFEVGRHPSLAHLRSRSTRRRRSFSKQSSCPRKYAQSSKARVRDVAAGCLSVRRTGWSLDVIGVAPLLARVPSESRRCRRAVRSPQLVGC